MGHHGVCGTLQGICGTPQWKCSTPWGKYWTICGSPWGGCRIPLGVAGHHEGYVGQHEEYVGHYGMVCWTLDLLWLVNFSRILYIEIGAQFLKHLQVCQRNSISSRKSNYPQDIFDNIKKIPVSSFQYIWMVLREISLHSIGLYTPYKCADGQGTIRVRQGHIREVIFICPKLHVSNPYKNSWSHQQFQITTGIYSDYVGHLSTLIPHSVDFSPCYKSQQGLQIRIQVTFTFNTDIVKHSRVAHIAENRTDITVLLVKSLDHSTNQI